MTWNFLIGPSSHLHMNRRQTNYLRYRSRFRFPRWPLLRRERAASSRNDQKVSRPPNCIIRWVPLAPVMVP